MCQRSETGATSGRIGSDIDDYISLTRSRTDVWILTSFHRRRHAQRLLAAEKFGMDTVQVFTKNQQQWKCKPLDRPCIDEWSKHRKRLKFKTDRQP